MYQLNITVQKRNGSIVMYEFERIQTAIMKALISTEEVPYNQMALTASRAATLTERTLLMAHSQEEQILATVEEIQDIVEETLMSMELPKTAKAYILYRKQHERARNNRDADAYIKKLIEDYIGPVKDWRVRENSTVSVSLGGLILSNSGSDTANYWLNEVYDEDIKEAHSSAAMHIHDLSMLSGYCAGWSLKQLIQRGIGGVEGRITSAPARHLSTLCNHMVNFLGVMQNEWAGAQAFSSFDTYLAPFVRKDGLNYKQVKQCIQNFIYGVNIPARWGTQAPFTNITLDWVCPNDMKNLPALVGGEEMDFTYGDCQAEMDMVNKAFIEIMIEGDANGRGFQYPIPTYSITKDFDWSDTENNRLLFEMTAKYGTPYFSNYINSDMEPSDVRAMCCRLRLDLRELRKKSGGYFGSGESTGSIGVVTLNMPRLAYLSKSEEEFYARLARLMDIAARSLDTKRKLITRLLNEGLYPYTKAYLGSFDNHFSTIGLVGMNEACRNAKWLQCSIADPAGHKFAEEVLDFMRNRLSDYQVKYEGTLFNLEATPAESTAYRLAKHDVERYPDIITAAKKPGDTPYYTNSSQLPVGFTDDIFDALDLQDSLQTRYTSGTVFHAFLGERLPNWKAAADLVKKIAQNYKLPYYTMSPTYSVCDEHGYLAGEVPVCPKCGKPTEVYSRITGYYRPIKNWNDGKLQEFSDRKTYELDGKMPGKYVVDSAETGCQNGSCSAPQVTPANTQAPEEITAITLVATKTCPNCKMAARFLNDAGIEFIEIFADEHPGIISKYQITSAPTLLVPDDNDVKKIVNASNINAFIKDFKRS